MNIATAEATRDCVEAILRLHRRRGEAFGEDLFGDPAWELLLQLFAARLEGRKTRLADLAGALPQSTLARWAAVLQERGLISCRLGLLDSGDLWVELSNNGAVKMSALFDSLDHVHPAPWPWRHRPSK